MANNLFMLESLETRRLLVLGTPVLTLAEIFNTAGMQPPLILPPTAQQVTTRIALESPISGATDYLIERALSPSGPWISDVAEYHASSLSLYHIKNLSGQKYYFHVSATDGQDVSPWSDPIAPRTPYDEVVQVEIDSSQSSADTLMLKWPVNSLATAYYIDHLVDGEWDNVKQITSGAENSTGVLFTDADFGQQGLDTSMPVELRVTRYEISGAYNGYVRAGLDLDAVHDRGDVLLVIDKSVIDHTESLNAIPEVNQLKADLIGEGWVVHTLEVERDFDDYRPTLSGGEGSDRSEVLTIKGQIKSIASQEGVSLKSILLIGHVPIPMSGAYPQHHVNNQYWSDAPDGHYDHAGAWVADAYYGDLVDNIAWADDDEIINDRFALQTNIDNDGKFDNATIPSDIEAALGRIDFYRMVDYCQAP